MIDTLFLDLPEQRVDAPLQQAVQRRQVVLPGQVQRVQQRIARGQHGRPAGVGHAGIDPGTGLHAARGALVRAADGEGEDEGEDEGGKCEGEVGSEGGEGDDTLIGGDGNDILIGGGLLGADEANVNVKAKTHEKVDSIGEERSIACHAVVLLVRQ